MVQQIMDDNCAQSTGGFGVVGCLEYVRVAATVPTLATITETMFPTAGEVQPIGFLDSRTDVDGYLEEPKVGGTDVIPNYDGDTAGVVNARSFRVVDQNATAWRAGINLVGAIPVIITPTTKLSFDLRNPSGAAIPFEFYFLFLRAA